MGAKNRKPASWLNPLAWLRGRMAKKSLTLEQMLRNYSGSGRISTARPYSRNVWVHISTRRLADSLMGVPLKLSRDPGNARESIVETGEVYDLLRKPNRRHTWKTFAERTVLHVMLSDGCYWILPKVNAYARGREILPVPASRITVETGEDQYGFTDAIAYKMRAERSGKTHTFLSEQVVPVLLPDPEDEIAGLSPIDAADEAIRQDLAAAQWNSSLFENGAEIGNVWSSDQALTDEQATELLRKIEARHRGASKSKRDTILCGGLHLEKNTATHKDLEFAGGKALTRQEILSAIGAFPVLVGLVENANRANSRTQEELWWTITVMPLAERIAEILTENVVQRWDQNLFAWFDFSGVPVLQERRLEMVESLTKLQAAGIPLNDILDRMDLGYGPYPWGAEPMIAFNLAPLKSVLEPPAAELPEGDGADEEEAAEEAVEEEEEKTIEVRAPSQAERDRLSKSWRETWRPIEKQALGATQRFFRTQRDGVLSRLRAFEQTEQGYQKCEAGDLTTRDLIAEVVFDLLAERGRIQVVATTFLRTAVTLGAQQAAEEAGQLSGTEPAPLGPSDPAIAALIAARKNKIRDVPNLTYKKLKAALAEGTNAGETIPQLAGRVRGLYEREIGTTLQPGRALRIARTEVPAAVNGARTEGFRAAAIDGKSWLTARAGEVRETHQAAERDTISNPIPIDAKFQVGNSRLDYPGDPAGEAKEVINCRCAILAGKLTNNSKTIEVYFSRGFRFRHAGEIVEQKEARDGQQQNTGQPDDGQRDGADGHERAA